VGEVWIWKEEKIQMHVLRGEEYQLTEKSRLCPDLDLSLLCLVSGSSFRAPGGESVPRSAPRLTRAVPVSAIEAASGREPPSPATVTRRAPP
jgi:hypothetical protein